MSDHAPLLLDYRAADKTIAAFHASTADIRYIRGCRASSKSSACVMDLFSQATRMPPGLDKVRRSKFLIGRATYPSLVKTTLETVKNWLGPVSETRYSVPPVTRVQQLLADGTSIDCTLLYQNLPDVASLQNLRSLELTGAYLSEVIEMPLEVLSGVSGSIGRYPGKNLIDPKYLYDTNGVEIVPYRAGIIIDTNPGELDGGWQKWEDSDGGGDAAIFIQPGAYLEMTETQITAYVRDNPHIKPHVIEKFGWYYVPNPAATFVRIVPGGFGYWAKIIKSASDRSEILMLCVNNWAASKAGMPCWPGYSDEMHLSRDELDPNPSLPIVVGIDHSGVHPAAVICQQQGNSLVLFESMSPSDDTGGTGFQEFMSDALMPALAARYAGLRVQVVVDPAIPRDALTARTVLDGLVEYGLSGNVAPSNNPKLRLDSVAKRLTRKAGIVVSKGPHTSHILKALRGGHHFGRNTDGTTKLSPAKGQSSHVADALGYASTYLDIGGRTNASAAGRSKLAGRGSIAR